MLHLNSKGYTIDDKNGDSGSSKDPIEELKWLLAAEITSLNSFDRCLKTPSAVSLHQISELCRDIHAVNVQAISRRLADLGAEVPQCTDLWHSFLELIGSTTAIFGEEAILGAFRKHEFALLDEYENKIASFDSENLVLVQGQLIPNQIKVCEILGAVKKDLTEMMTNTDLPLNANLA